MVKRALNISLAIKMLNKIDLYVYFSQNWVHIEDELLETYNEIWEKVKNVIKKEFDIEPVYCGKIK